MPLENSPTAIEKPGRLALTYREAATSLGICERSVWEMVRTGKVRAISIGRSRRIPVAELERLLAE